MNFTLNWLDIVTTILGLAYILFEYRASVWMWVVGFTMQVLGIVLYYQKGLYADCSMEFYYLAMTVYGFWKWKAHPSPPKGRDVQLPVASSSNQTPSSSEGLGEASISITHMPRHIALRWSIIMVSLWALIYWLLVTFTNSTVPLADSFTTALSMVGIWALAHKYLEQWFVWIAVDVVTSVLYFHKDIPFKASLYALYVVIAILGYFKWKRSMAAASH
jgi:nicotinamide mononucleotide transporter